MAVSRIKISDKDLAVAKHFKFDAELKNGVTVQGVSGIPFHLVLDEYRNQITVQDILDEPNAEKRRIYINLYGGYTKFIKNGGGQVIKKGRQDDYQDAEIVALTLNNETAHYLKLINQTPVEDWEQLTTAQREAMSLDEQGRKIYVEEYSEPQEFADMYDEIGSTWGLPPGMYRKINAES